MPHSALFMPSCASQLTSWSPSQNKEEKRGDLLDALRDQNTPSRSSSFSFVSPSSSSRRESVPNKPALAMALLLISAHISGYLLCTARGDSPLCSAQSKGRYSPKSAIHPDAPVFSAISTMTSSIHAAAAGLVRSSSPYPTPGSVPSRYTFPLFLPRHHVALLLGVAVQRAFHAAAPHQERVHVRQNPRVVFFSHVVSQRRPIRVRVLVKHPVPPDALYAYAGVPRASPVLEPQTGDRNVRGSNLLDDALRFFRAARHAQNHAAFPRPLRERLLSPRVFGVRLDRARDGPRADDLAGHGVRCLRSGVPLGMRSEPHRHVRGSIPGGSARKSIRRRNRDVRDGDGVVVGEVKLAVRKVGEVHGSRARSDVVRDAGVRGVPRPPRPLEQPVERPG
mmetsp:Transcript_6193/g.26312  ORF Transcript_6193/g.26312 Transcript_6193/m.26312 type:complete len:393 (-) Transcript_6193:1182-2360(-)